MFGQPSASPFASPAAGTTNTSPFGQPSTTGFGQPAGGGGGFGTTFGSPAPAPAGATPFGAAPSTGAFGSAAAAPTTSGFGGFGAPAPAPSTGLFGGGGAGAATTTGAFGSQPATTTGAFGSQPSSTTTGAFGSTTAAPAFGSPSPAPSTGLFGGGAGGATTGAFGSSSATTGAFGSTTTTSAFGAPAPAPSTGLFGGGGATTGAFGSAPAPAPSGFGGFGSPPAASGGLFGAPAAGAAPAFGSPATGKPGTLAVPYQVTSKSDGTTTINIQAITAMDAYQNKSFEELRLEDYTAGNKGSQGQQPAAAAPTGGFGGFGAAPAPATGGLFGGGTSSTTGAFGAQPAATTGAFGAPATTSAFGAPAPAPSTGLFGGGATTGAFGSAPAPAPSGGLFGAPAPAPAASGGLFGAPAPAAAPAFGAAPAPAASGGLFGAPAPAPAAPGGLFGAPAPAPGAGGLFGSAPAPAPAPGGLFGTPAPAPAPGTSLFGAAPAPSAGGLFGSTPAPAPAPGGGLFGAPAPAPGGLFGAPAPAATGGLFGAAPAPAGGGLFGAPATAPATTGGLFGAAPAPAAPGGLFGAAAPQPGGSLFGAQPAPAMAPMGIAHTAVAPPTADALLAQQLAAVENQKKELALLEAWRGNPPSGSNVIPSSLSERDARSGAAGLTGGGSSYAAPSAALLTYQAAPRSAAKIRPRGFGPIKTPPPVGSIGGRSPGGSPLLSPDAYLGSSAKRLVIKPGSLTPKPKMRLLLTDGNADDGKKQGEPSEEAIQNGVIGGIRSPASAADSTPTQSTRQDENAGVAGVQTPASMTASVTGNGAVASAPRDEVSRALNPSDSPAAMRGPSVTETESTPAKTPSEKQELKSSLKKKSSPANGFGYDFYRQVVGSPKDDAASAASPAVANGPESRAGTNRYVPKLTKIGYIVSPQLHDLAAMSEADLAAVSGFQVERPGYGIVAWDGAVDVRGVDLDSVVIIESRDVAVYDAEEANGTKPPVGSKLNRPAVITMFKVYPKDGPGASEETKEKFERKIAKSTKKMGAELISYESSTGTWKFRVGHFSRYGLADSDDSDDEEDGPVERESSQDNTPDFEMGESGGLSPAPGQDVVGKKERGGRSRMKAPISEDEEMSQRTEDDSAVLMSDGETSGGGRSETQVIEAAEAAYALISQTGMGPAPSCAAGGSAVPNSLGLDAPISHEEFEDEGEASSEYVIKSPTPPELGVNDSLRRQGICSKIAQKSGIKAPSSSSTDFGMRMRRSFRIGWRPDGSFLHLKNGSNALRSSPRGAVLVQSRPVFREERSALTDVASTTLFQTHLRNKVTVEGTDDGCPLFTLPEGIRARDATMSSYKALCKALDDFARSSAAGSSNPGEDPELTMLLARAFSLLSALYGQEDDAFEEWDELELLPVNDQASQSAGADLERSTPALRRRIQAFTNWLRGAVANDVSKEIESTNNIHDAIFSAITGGDRSKATALAIEKGQLRLSAMLANAGPQAAADLQIQRQQWRETGAEAHISTSLLRIYALLSGDLRVEENLYKTAGAGAPNCMDWRRRLGLRLWPIRPTSQTISSTVQQYGSDVANGVAPPPVPRYLTSANSKGTLQSLECHCILYQLLASLYADGTTREIKAKPSLISKIVSPLGHTPSRHDFLAAFHFSSAISALHVYPSMTQIEEDVLVNSVISQLICAGSWEWAVYSALCIVGGGIVDNRVVYARREKAKEIILRHYTDDTKIDPHSTRRRSFLESIGIPSSFFDEASAQRSAYRGDIFSYVRHSIEYSLFEASKATEEILLPNLIMARGDSTEKLVGIFEVLNMAGPEQEPSWNEPNRCGAFYDLLKLSEKVLRLSQIPRGEQGLHSDEIAHLLSEATDLQGRIFEDDSHDEERSLRMMLPFDVVPRSIFVAEAVSILGYLKAQLLALQQGFSVFEESFGQRKLKLASQLAILPSSDMDTFVPSREPLGSESMLRGLYGLA